MKRRRAAFTLIECVLALGITATILVALMSLLPAGLDATRTATLRNAEARIIGRIRQQSETTPVLGDFYFDALGSPVDKKSVEAVLAVRVAAEDGVALPGDVSASLRSIRITLGDRMIRDPFADERHLHVHHLLLAPAANGGSP